MRFRSWNLFLLFGLAAHAVFSQIGIDERTRSFYLHDGDTVVFYGDSITEQAHYTHQIALYVTTRFPHRNIVFYNAGVGGDRVSGGAGGPVDERLARDVFPYKPNVVTIMLGMNDGSYRNLDDQIESTYTHGYEHIVQSLQQSLPGVRLTLLGPSPFDEITQPSTIPGYNRSLIRFAAIDKELAGKYKADFIDLNAPTNAGLQRGLEIAPKAITLEIPDRVHPEPVVHWFMTEAILKGWNAPALVSSTTLDATSLTATELVNAHVTELKGDPTALSWTELEDALPLPLAGDNATDHLLLQISDIVATLDQEPLKVLNLRAGRYELSIDNNKTGNFTSQELAAGINLATLSTPMRGQAYQVSWLLSDRDRAHAVRYHLLRDQKKTGFPAEPAASELTKFEAMEQKAIFDAAQPKTHKFRLKLVGQVP